MATDYPNLTIQIGKRKSELKPCPFCGGEAVIIAVDFADGDTWYRPECSECKCGWQENLETVDGAITAWNTRTKESEVD